MNSRSVISYSPYYPPTFNLLYYEQFIPKSQMSFVTLTPPGLVLLGGVKGEPVLNHNF